MGVALGNVGKGELVERAMVWGEKKNQQEDLGVA